MRKILLILGQNEKTELFAFLNSFADGQIILSNNEVETTNLLVDQKFSIIVLYGVSAQYLMAIKRQNLFASYLVLLKPNCAFSFFELIEQHTDDEMMYDGSELSQRILSLKISRLLEKRWDKRIIRLYNTFLSGFPNSLITTHTNGDQIPRVVFFNEAFVQKSGLHYGDLLNKPLDLFKFYGIDREKDKIAGGQGYIKTNFVHHAEGQKGKEYFVHIIPVFSPNSSDVEYLIAFENERIENTTRLAEVQEALALSTRKMKAQVEFLASIAHDIRKPLNNIIGLVDLFNETELSEEQEFINISLSQSSRNLKSLINDLLDVGKMESGNFEIVNKYFNIRKLISGLDIMFRKEAITKNLDFSCQVDDKIPAMLEGDENRIAQIMVNLIGNSLKFTDSGSVKIQVDLVSMNESQATVSFKIIDTGIGIKKEDQQRIFESYEQAKTNDAQKYGGTGLGLTICKRLCKLMRGTISVKSEWQAGSVFSVELPFKLTPLFVGNIDNHQTKDLNGLEILIIDDSSLTNFVLDKLLTKWNAVVTTATTGKMGYNYFKDKNFDMVITDIQLPDMNGMRLAVRLKDIANQRQQQVPIMGISAFPYPSKQIANNKLDDFLLKPISAEELYEKIVFLRDHKNELLLHPNFENFMTYQIIDTNRIKIFANNDVDFIRQLIEIFLKRTPEYMDDLRSAIEKKDWANIKMLAHKLKPTFTYVGMEKFTEKVGSIEEFALKQDLNSIISVMDEVWEECQMAFYEFDDFLKSLD